MLRRFALLALLCAASCGVYRVPEPWFDEAALREAARHMPADVNGQQLEVHTVVRQLEDDGHWNIEDVQHFAFAVRTAGKLPTQWQRFAVKPGDQGEILARVLLPDGTIRPVAVVRANLNSDDAGDVQAVNGAHAFLLHDLTLEANSIVEVILARVSSGALSVSRLSPRTDMPVRHARFDLYVPEEWQLETRSVGLPQAVTRLTGHGEQHVQIDAADLPADSTETWTLPRSLRDRWALVRVKRFAESSPNLPDAANWATALRVVAQKLLQQNASLLVGPPPEFAPADPFLPRASQLFVQVRDGLATTSFGAPTKIRPRAQVLGLKSGSAGEKAFVLWSVLQTAGIDARLALTTRFATEFFDPTLPVPETLNHLIVQLPPSYGANRWLDPSCEACAPGELPPWLRDAQAVVFWLEDKHDAPHLMTEVVAVTGPQLATSHDNEKLVVTLTEAGRADVSTLREWAGVRAMEILHEVPQTDDEARRKRKDAFVQSRDARAVADVIGEVQCDAKAVTCERLATFHVDGYATPTKDGLLVPLRVMGDAFGNTFADDTPRRHPAVVRVPFNLSEDLAVRLPPNMTIADTPQPVDVRVGAFHAACGAHQEGKDWIWHREMTLPQGIVPVAEFQGLRKVVRAFAACRDVIVWARHRP